MVAAIYKKKTCERDLLKMSKTKKNTHQNKNSVKKNNSIVSNFFKTHPFIISIAASIAATLLINICSKVIFFPSEIGSKLDTIGQNIEQLNKDFDNLKNNMKSIDDDIYNLKLNISTIANLTGINIYTNLEYTDTFLSELAVRTETIENDYYSSAPPCKDGDIIAVSTKNGKEYTKAQLAGQKLLIPYKSNGQEILFYGQYNEKNNWDKDCVINVYENNILILISETEYKDGIPVSFRQAFPSKNKSGKSIWNISDREYFGDVSDGKTWSYLKFNECYKNFEFSEATVDNIIYRDVFKNDIKNFSVLEGYYHGKVQNGSYNHDDADGNKSVMVKYDAEGFIRTLYIGNFKNGDFFDTTGTAEEIVYDESVNKYFHYTGTFSDGERDGDNLNYITQDEINKITKDYEFDCELKWHDTN